MSDKLALVFPDSNETNVIRPANGENCAYTPRGGFWFQFDEGEDVEGWLDGAAKNIQIKVLALDVGTQPITVRFTTDGATTVTETIGTKQNSGEWVWFKKRLSAALLPAHDLFELQNDASFRIGCAGPLGLMSVSVKDRASKAVRSWEAMDSALSDNPTLESADYSDDDSVGFSVGGAKVRIKNGDVEIAGGVLDAASITATQIANATITATQIANATITSAQIASGTITSANILNGTIVGADIASATIAGSNIATTTITAANIQALTITANEIANLTITAGQIANATITGAKIVSATITGGLIASATIAGSNIAGGTITGSNIAGSTITAANIQASTITGALIANSTITGSNIAGSTITAANIAGATITATQIAAGTITGSNIAGATITAAQLSATAIDSMTITGATIRTAASGARTEMHASNLFGLGFGGVGGYNGSTVQWYAKASDGKFYFAGGNGILDNSGIYITPDSVTFNPNKAYRFQNGATENGGMYATQAATFNDVRVIAKAVSGIDTQALLMGYAPTGKTVASALYVTTQNGTGFGKASLEGSAADVVTFNVVTDAITLTPTGSGIKIGTSTSHKVGFYNATPVARPSAYTQTYSTADKTHANPTANAITNNTGGNASTTTFAAITAGATYAQLDMQRARDDLAGIASQLNKLRSDHLDLAQLVNAMLNDLQSIGLFA